MVQNLRVDIIYHLSPSDFEMEFNLSGCCRMRLLSDKTSDKTSIEGRGRYMSKKYIFKYNGSKESFLTIPASFHTNNSRFYYFDDYIIEVLDDEIRFGVERTNGERHTVVGTLQTEHFSRYAV